MEVFEWNGWYGSINVEENTSQGVVHYGKLLFMNDCITYESLVKEDLYEEFRSAVLEYLEDCVELDKLPQKVKLIRGDT